MQTELIGKPHEASETGYAGLLGMRLGVLMRLIRESGLPTYEREIGYKDIHRHLILLVGMSGGLSSQEIVALAGYEKAQVSRAIKPLERDGLMERERLRAKLTLLPPGRKLFERILAIAHERDAVLTAGIAAADLKRFAVLTDALMQQAARMYAEERQLSVDAGIISPASIPMGPPSWPQGPDGKPVKPPPHLITPKLVGLAVYMKRSAMLAYQRSHGLSNFQWQVFSLIGRHPPLPMAQLILAMARDKSQIGRTVSHLEQAGLIVRFRPTRRRDIMLEPTEHGAAAFRTMYEVARRRDEALWNDRGAADRTFYSEIVDELSARAREMITEGNENA